MNAKGQRTGRPRPKNGTVAPTATRWACGPERISITDVEGAGSATTSIRQRPCGHCGRLRRRHGEQASVSYRELAGRFRCRPNQSEENPLGEGSERLFDNLGDAELRLEQVRAVEAPGVTHLKYRVIS
jgi:hypothetical protein